MVRSDATDNVATRFVVPAFSAAVTSLIEIVGAASSSVIVIVPTPDDELIVAFKADDNVNVNASFSSSMVSAKIGMLTVLLVSPALNVKVPDVDV